MIGKTNSGVGSGGLSLKNAIIHVNAPIGSTVEFSFGGVIVKTILPEKAFVNMDNETADYYYSVKAANYGTWTITATLGNIDDTTSDTVTVNDIKQYDIELTYELYIIHHGVYGKRSLVKWGGVNDVVGTGYRIYKTAGSTDTVYYTDAQIDLTDYATARIVLTGGKWNYNANFGFTTTKHGYSESGSSMFPTAYVSLGARTISQTTNVNIDIHNATGSAWFGFGISWSGSVSDSTYATGGFKVTDIYLSK